MNRSAKKGRPPLLDVQTLGALALRLGDRDIRIAGRKSRAIVGYLALRESGEESRERLVGLLWSESEEEKARASLRQCVHEIRDAFHATGFDGFLSEKRSIALPARALRLDLGEILDQAKAGSPHTRLLETQGLTDSILSEVETVDPVFRTWLLAKRQSLQDTITRHLEGALRVTPLGTVGESLASAILNLDPTHEEACRHLMRSRAERGDVAGALKAYKALWDLLEQEFDTEPSGQTQALVAQIKMGKLPMEERLNEPKSEHIAPAIVAVQSDSETGRNSLHALPSAKLVLAIAPFDLSGVEPGRRYVVQGFRRELIGCLVRFREWLIREQMTAVPLHAATEDEYVLEAYATRASSAVRIALTLRDGATNAYLWSESVQLSIANWSEAQQMIVRRIATALNVHVSAGRIAMVAPKSGADLLAYDLWLRGQARFLTYEPLGWQDATKIFHEIISRYPEFAPAYSSLAQLQNTVHFVHPGTFRDADVTQEALSYAVTATRLDPMDSRAQLCLGWANAMAGRYEQAALHHRLAHELNGNDPWTLVSSALGFAFRGEPGQARPLAERALNLCPTPNGTHWRYQAMVRYMGGDYEGCVAAAQQAESSIQNVFVWKAAALYRLGRKDEAKAAAEQFFKAVEKHWFNREMRPTKEIMSRWFLHAFPISLSKDWERLRDDFAGAGAPVDGLQHNVW